MPERQTEPPADSKTIRAQAERIEKLCVENSILWEKNRTQAERIENLLAELLRLCEAEWQAVDNHPGSRWAKEVAFFKQALKETRENADGNFL